MSHGNYRAGCRIPFWALIGQGTEFCYVIGPDGLTGAVQCCGLHFNHEARKLQN